MTEEIIIWSFFTSECNLADHLKDWKEFVGGQGYLVDLKDTKTGVIVSIREVVEWEDHYITIQSSAPNEFFDRVVGRVIGALSLHSGYLKVKKSRDNKNKFSFDINKLKKNPF